MKQPAQMRMMEAIVVEASRWDSLTTNTFKVGKTFSILVTNTVSRFQKLLQRSMEVIK